MALPDAISPRDENRVTTLLGTDINTINTAGRTPVVIGADPTTHRLLVSAVITGGGSAGSQYVELDTTAPGTGTLALGRYKSSSPTLTDGQMYGLQLDSTGALRVASTGGAAGTQYAELTTTAPATGTVALGRYKSSAPTLTDGQLYAPQLDVNGNLKVTIASGGSSGTQYADGAVRGTATGTLAMVDDGTNIQSIAGDTAGNQFVVLKTNGVLSTANSTSANLSAAGVFTGTGEDVLNYSAIQVSVYSSHASATDGLSLQQSSDNTNWDFIDTYTIPATSGKVFSVQPTARYFRIVYTNGATLTTSLRIQTVYHIVAPNPSSQRPSDAYTNETDMTQNWAFSALYNGTTWDRMRGDITNGLDVDVTRLPSLVAGSATIGAVNIAAAQTLATVTTVGTVTTLTGTTSLTPGVAATNLGKAEDAAHTSGDTGVAVWGVRNDNAATTLTSANGDYSPFATDGTGTTFTRNSPANTAALTTVTSSATSTTLLAANPSRRLMTCYNASTSDAYVKFGTTASTTSFSIFLQSLGSFSLNGEDYAGRIDIIWNSANGFAYVTETTL